MSKYSYEVNRILEICYSKEDMLNYNPRSLHLFEKRIGYGYSLKRYPDEVLRFANAHVRKICGSVTRCEICALKQFCQEFRLKAVKEPNKDQLKIADLFCGAGGFTLGFTQLGYQVVFAIDNQECCVNTYRINNPDVAENAIICKDIEESNEQLVSINNDVKIDVVVGGPPCQGFSMANRQRMIEDPRNRLYKYFVRAIEQVAPAFFVMENVEGILKIKDEVIEDFSNLRTKYNVIPTRINAIDFGLPQNRKRVFFIGTRLNVDLDQLVRNINLKSKGLPRFVLGDALLGLRVLKANNEKNSTENYSYVSGGVIERNDPTGYSEYIERINCHRAIHFTFNHKAKYNNNRDIEIFSRLLPGDRSDDPKIADIMPYSNRNHIFKDKYYRLRYDRPCKTITAHMQYDCNMYIHPDQSRVLTPREAARIQTFPDDYYFCRPYSKTYMQIGNSVPPAISRIIAQTIKEFIVERTK